ncbi:polyamine aminopropyltransferase [bacterium]|nr:polyamine aminopropyltransferase [bacterium]
MLDAPDLSRHYEDAGSQMTFTEWDPPGRGSSWQIVRAVESVRTPYQLIELYETETDGKLLVHDGAVMLTERDEHVYHELLVHVPLLTHPNPKRVLVIGGGDGGTLREIVRHPSVVLARQVEIDEDVVRISREHLPELAKGFESDKVDLIIGDGIQYVKDAEPGSYDVILVDSTDPVGPAQGLFTEEFYRNCYRALADDGVLAAQTTNFHDHLDLLVTVVKMLRGVFGSAEPYNGMIPDYPSGNWCLTLATKGPDPMRDLEPDRVEAIQPACRYWNPRIHQAAFAMPTDVERALV